MEKIALHVVMRLRDAGFTTFFAGGWVRDYLMGHVSDDIDIATSAGVEEIENLFPKTIPVGKAFGIIIVVEQGIQFEVATFRTDGEYVDGRHPTGVKKATPREDAQRRDFTINGLFFDPVSREVIDYVGGRDDIEKKIVRAIGSPLERFREDRLRMVRAVRYSSRFGFPIERETRAAIVHEAHALMECVAVERIWDEFAKMAKFGKLGTSLRELHELGLLKEIFPFAEPSEKAFALIEKMPDHFPIIAAILEIFPQMKLEEVSLFCREQKLSKRDEKRAVSILKVRTMGDQKRSRAQWAKLYTDPDMEMSLRVFALRLENSAQFLHEKEALKKALQPHIDRLIEKKPVVTSHHLMEEGVKPGQKMGDLLDLAIEISINEDLVDPRLVIERLRGKM